MDLNQLIMEVLKKIIRNVPIESYGEWFKAIAEELINRTFIETKNGAKYQITEAEFYYHNDLHPDTSTYGYIRKDVKIAPRILRHKLLQCETFTWFIHYSGIDFVIGRKNEPGGILIRAIRNIETNENISGPLVVMLELLNQADSEGIRLKLCPADDLILYKELKLSRRVGINYGSYEEELYNFSI